VKCSILYRDCLRYIIYVYIIRGRRKTSTSTYHSVTCTTGKEYKRKQGKVYIAKIYITDDETTEEVGSMIYNVTSEVFFFNSNSGGMESNWVHSARRPPIGLFYLPPVDYEDGEFGEMIIGMENRSTRRKPAPVPNCLPQTPHALPGCEPGPQRWGTSDKSLELWPSVSVTPVSNEVSIMCSEMMRIFNYNRFEILRQF
jgi:hypothetical protein